MNVRKNPSPAEQEREVRELVARLEDCWSTSDAAALAVWCESRGLVQLAEGFRAATERPEWREGHILVLDEPRAPRPRPGSLTTFTIPEPCAPRPRQGAPDMFEACVPPGVVSRPVPVAFPGPEQCFCVTCGQVKGLVTGVPPSGLLCTKCKVKTGNGFTSCVERFSVEVRSGS